MKKNKGVSPEEVIHDYQYLLPLVGSWKTNLGNKLGDIYLEFGLAISRYVEDFFSK